LTVLLIVGREQVRGILSSIRLRIERGDPFQAGPGGFSVGQSDAKLTHLRELETRRSDAGSTQRTIGDIEVPGVGDEEAARSAEEYRDVVYLIHRAGSRGVDSDGRERREIRVILDADSKDVLDEVERVVYHLHPTFPYPTREVADRDTSFELSTRAWGQFNLKADVYFGGCDKPLTLYRYLNF